MHEENSLKFGGNMDYDNCDKELIRFWVSWIKGQGHHKTNYGQKFNFGAITTHMYQEQLLFMVKTL